MTTDTSTTQRAQETASTATDEGKHVAGVAADEARSVASDATTQVRNVVGDTVDQVRGQLDDQGRTQKDKLAGTLGSFSDDLAQMAENSSGLAANVAHEVAERARSISQQLDSREPAELLDDVRRFARQRPGTFLLGALAAGVVVGRLVRGTKDSIEAAEASGTGPSSSTTGTPRVTPGAPDTTSVHASHGQPTIETPVSPATAPAPTPVPPSVTGYSSPPAGTGLPGSAGDAEGGTLS
jgi:hypothetical protein